MQCTAFNYLLGSEFAELRKLPYICISIPDLPMKLSDKKLKLIEELGVIHERTGMQPAMARVIALLLVSDRTELTFEEIYETLNMSKSAASNALNFLLSTDRIEYITNPGERRRYFRFKAKSIKDAVLRALTEVDAFNSALKKVAEQRPASTREFNTKLEELTGFLDFIKKELPVLIEKWEVRKQ
jgi:DNA-binding transcriptional regulator GbsR (MarR family)